MNAYLKVVENEEESLCRQPLVEVHTVCVWWWHLVMERQCRTGIPHQVLPVCGRKTTRVQAAHQQQHQKVMGVHHKELEKALQDIVKYHTKNMTNSIIVGDTSLEQFAMCICEDQMNVYLILSESDGWGMCVQAASCIMCW